MSRSVSRATKLLIGLFYLLQGAANVVLGLFYIRVDVSIGGSTGFAAGMTILLKSSLLFASLLSFIFVVAMYFEFETATMFCGILSSLVFALFYGSVIMLLSSVIRNQFSLLTAFWFSLSVVVVVLNLVAFVFVGKIVSDMRSHH